jgi:hypothetical protein
MEGRRPEIVEELLVALACKGPAACFLVECCWARDGGLAFTPLCIVVPEHLCLPFAWMGPTGRLS